MKRYPKFLKVLPEFYGLNFIDIGLVMAGLYGGLILKFSPLVTIALVGVFIGASKTIRKYVDVVGFLLPRKPRVQIKEQG